MSAWLSIVLNVGVTANLAGDIETGRENNSGVVCVFSWLECVVLRAT
jgi:hypothetical protein